MGVRVEAAAKECKSGGRYDKRDTVREGEEAPNPVEKSSVELACSGTSESERTTDFLGTAAAPASSSPPPPRAKSPKTRLPVLPQVILLRMVWHWRAASDCQ